MTRLLTFRPVPFNGCLNMSDFLTRLMESPPAMEPQVLDEPYVKLNKLIDLLKKTFKACKEEDFEVQVSRARVKQTVVVVKYPDRARFATNDSTIWRPAR